MDGPTLTREYEGCDLVAKPDTRGFVIGWGHNGPDVFPRLVWSQDQADAAFVIDYAKAVAGATADVGNVVWNELDDVRQAVLADMSFELGAVGLKDFRRMIAAIASEDWPTAYDEMLASSYAVEVPKRAKANAELLLTGTWPV